MHACMPIYVFLGYGFVSFIIGAFCGLASPR